jgi:hypothetical protein
MMIIIIKFKFKYGLIIAWHDDEIRYGKGYAEIIITRSRYDDINVWLLEILRWNGLVKSSRVWRFYKEINGGDEIRLEVVIKRIRI